MTIGRDINGEPGRACGKASAFAAAALAAVLLLAAPAFAAPRENYCQMMAARGEDFGQCVKEEKEAIVKLRNRHIETEVKEFCDSVATGITGKSHALMLQCVEDLEKRASGAAGRGGGKKR